MYVFAAVLFLIPSTLIFFGGVRAFKARKSLSEQTWRTKCVLASLLAASFATVMGLASSLDWLHLGGDPHGGGTPPGLWQPLFRVMLWALAVCVILAIPGKGKGRFLALGAAAAAFLAVLAVVLMNMD
jgi:hypothetical protein